MRRPQPRRHPAVFAQLIALALAGVAIFGFAPSDEVTVAIAGISQIGAALFGEQFTTLWSEVKSYRDQVQAHFPDADPMAVEQQDQGVHIELPGESEDTEPEGV